MKRNNFMRIASVLMIAVLISTCAISGTFAKYTSTVTGSDNARVALWKFNFGADDTQIGNNFTFNLFDYTDGNVDENGLEDDSTVIAPGTKGQFELAIENVSEVNATYTITFAETNEKNIPLRYSVDNTTWYDSITEMMTASDSILKDQAVNMGATKKQIVYWEWVFDSTSGTAHAGQTDVTDTTLGLDGTFTVTIDATIVVTQVN